MRNISILTSLCFAMTLGLTACDDKAADKKTEDKKEDKKDGDKKDAADDGKAADDKAADEKADAPPPAAAVEVSEEMKGFLAKFDGTDAGVEGALKEFGANEEISGDDMGMYMLKDPKVVSKEGDCFMMEAAAGITTRSYNVCWAEGKINKIEDKGMR